MLLPALSSLSSQSPPPSPFAPPSTDNPPPLPRPLPLPPQTALSPSEKVGELARSEAKPLGQSGGEAESFDQSPGGPWEPRAWPEGQQVLTHLVEGFVIQEGLQPFPVRLSSIYRNNTHIY